MLETMACVVNSLRTLGSATKAGSQRVVKETFEDVQSHIARAQEQSQEKLSLMRSLVRTAAPQAEEMISYNMPYYKYNGPLVGFAAYKDHVSLFGAFPAELRGELKDYKTGRGSVQFPLDKPLPSRLITKIVKAHLSMNEARVSMHRKGARG
jgi:uncharacterized protein YdhG (YjbR/CyaY superfamily)